MASLTPQQVERAPSTGGQSASNEITTVTPPVPPDHFGQTPEIGQARASPARDLVATRPEQAPQIPRHSTASQESVASEPLRAPPPTLANHSRIVALNDMWEKSYLSNGGTEAPNQAQRGSKSSPSGPRGTSSDDDGIVAKSAGWQHLVGREKHLWSFTSSRAHRNATEPPETPVLSSSTPQKTSSATALVTSRGSSVEDSDVRAQARRLAEASAMKQISQAQALSSKPVVKKNVSRASKPVSQPVMRFATGNQLLARVLQGASASPAASDSIVLNPDEEDSDKTTSDVDDKAFSRSTYHSLVQAKGDHGALELAADGQAYTQFRCLDTNAAGEPGRGALFPANYKLLTEPPRYVCAIRECRLRFGVLVALGIHFIRSHKGAKLNDNLDGTFSQVGTYKKLSGHSPPIVVSREPLPADALSPVEPSIPRSWAAKSTSSAAANAPPGTLTLATMASRHAAAARRSTAQQSTPSRTLRKSRHSPTLQYLHRYLDPAQMVPNRTDINHMLSLQRRRDFPSDWIDRHRNSILSTNLYAASLAYLVGDEIRGADACTRGKGLALWRPSRCIALPSTLLAHAKAAFSKNSSCVGCYYNSALRRQANRCDWIYGNRSREEPLMLFSDDEGGSEAGASSLLTGTDEAAGTAMALGEQPQGRMASGALGSVEAGPRASQKTIAVSEMGDIEMESWEFAPGRLMDASGSENIAFSSSYLNSSQPVLVAQDVGLNVVVVRPGSSADWTAEANVLRLCTVASGKVRLKAGEKTGQLGPNGAFVIRPGQTLRVENWLYVDAVVHCTTIKEYELTPEDD